MGTIEINGTGGIIEGNLEAAIVNVNLDPVMELSGGTDHISGAFYETPFTSSFTMSCWIKPADGNPAVEERFLSALGDTWPQNTATVSLLSNGKISFNYKANNNNAMATPVDATFTDGGNNSWTHVAVTANSSTGGANGLSIYINGKEVALGSGGGDGSTGSTAGVTFADWDGDSATEIAIGALNNDYTFAGQMADAKVFTDILDDDEIEFLASKINCDSLAYGIDNRVGWWKLNEGSGTTITDYDDNSTEYALSIQNPLGSSANWQFDAFSVNVQKDGTTTDGTLTVTQGKLEGKALSYVHNDATNDATISANAASAIDDLTALTKGTVACWTRADNWTNTDDHWIYVLSDSTDDYFFMVGMNASGKVRSALFENGAYQWDLQTDAVVCSLDKWHHIAVTQDGTGPVIYVDGVKPAQTFSNSTDTAAWWDELHGIGADKNFLGGGFMYNNNAHQYEPDGDFRDFRFYNHGLSAEQASSLYSGSYNITPMHWIKCDEGSGTLTD